MRITKKFAGSNGIGKQVFSPCTVSEKSNDVRRALFAELDSLERVFLQKVESSQSVSFPVSAKALAFSAKLQMKVQQAPLLTHDYSSPRLSSRYKTRRIPVQKKFYILQGLPPVTLMGCSAQVSETIMSETKDR